MRQIGDTNARAQQRDQQQRDVPSGVLARDRDVDLSAGLEGWIARVADRPFATAVWAVGVRWCLPPLAWLLPSEVLIGQDEARLHNGRSLEEQLDGTIPLLF
jgi:hypothetical protein